MNKIFKFTAYGLLGIVALVAIVIGYVAATFNPNDYKSLIIKLVQEKKQRTLHLDGDIKLTFWPKLGADLGKVSLSEHNNNKEFASINHAQVSLALIPLLKKELVVDTIYIDGVNVTIIRHKDGTTNFDDLISKDEEESQQIKFDVDGVKVSNTEVGFIDEMNDAKYAINQFNLKTGHVALARPFDVETTFELRSQKPNVNAKFDISGNFMADIENKHYVVKKLDASINGAVASLKNANFTLVGDVDAKPQTMELLVDGLKFALKGDQEGAKISLNLSAPKLTVKKDVVTGKQADISFSQEKGSDKINANLALADVKGSPQAIQSSGIKGELSATQGSRHIEGKFSSPFTGNIDKLIFDLPKLAGNLNITDPALPKGSMKGSFNLNLHSDLKQEKINTDLAIDVDDLHLKGNIGIASFSNPVYQFNLDLNKLDADKYITKSDKPAENKSGDTPIDLSALKKLNAQGSFHIGNLKIANIKTSDVNLKLNANQGLAELAPFSANLYQGKMNGSLKIDARNTPSIAFKQTMSNIAIEPLLMDAINNDMLSGKGTLNLDITTQGNTVNALKKSLNGNAAINLADGAVKGIDIAGTIRGVKDKLNFMKQSNVTGDKTKKTDFAEMSASFIIKNGVAHNEDLNIKAPLFRIAGDGDVDIANETINYTAKPTVVNSLKGQGGSDLGILNGLTIPIKVTGTFAKPNYALDFSGLAAGIAKNKLLENVGGTKGDAIKGLISGNKADAIKSIISGGNKTAPTQEAAPAGDTTAQTPPPPASTPEEKVKKKLNKILGF
jgi:AsmA protein